MAGSRLSQVRPAAAGQCPEQPADLAGLRGGKGYPRWEPSRSPAGRRAQGDHQAAARWSMVFCAAHKTSPIGSMYYANIWGILMVKCYHIWHTWILWVLNVFLFFRPWASKMNFIFVGCDKSAISSALPRQSQSWHVMTSTPLIPNESIPSKR